MAEAVRLSTSSGCFLAIGGYPSFRYDGRGGGGLGRWIEASGPGGAPTLHFPPQDLTIPTLNGRSTRVLGLPLPPGLSIRILPEQLEGHWDQASGQLDLSFRARFRFRLALQRFELYQPPDLTVACLLSSEAAQGERHQARGQRVDARGQARLVGVARVPPSGDPWLDRFLGLPDEALAVLQCRLLVQAACATGCSDPAPRC